MLISCKYCGRIHDQDFICDQKKRAKREQKRPDPTEADRMRNSTAWQKKAEQIKADSHYLCAVCYDKGIYTCDKLEVHHIEKLKDAKEKFIDDGHTIYDMNVDAKWNTRREKEQSVYVSKEEKRTLILAAFKTYFPQILLIIGCFAATMILIFLWLM